MTSYLDLEAETRVSNGIDWLNENGPAEWWDRIDYDILDLDDGGACILGQVFAARADECGLDTGYIYVGTEQDFWNPEHLNEWTQFIVSNGFLAYNIDTDTMREEWINAIENIRAQVAA